MLTQPATSVKVPTFALEPQTQILGFRPEAREVVQALAGFSVFGLLTFPHSTSTAGANKRPVDNASHRAGKRSDSPVGNPSPVETESQSFSLSLFYLLRAFLSFLFLFNRGSDCEQKRELTL